MNKLVNFKKMHEQKKLLFLPNAWDVVSALVLEQSGFKAIGTTSWGVANSMGYKDGENIDFNELLMLVRKIISIVDVPVTVDIESGYSEHIDGVVENVMKIADIGAVGINIEDSLKNNRSLNDKNKHCELIAQIRKALDGKGYNEFFINARVDTYLVQENPLEETLERSTLYVANGANGIFVPGVHQNEDIKRLVASINAPLNILSLPNITDIDNLNSLGVKRFSIGNALSDAAITFVEDKARALMEQKNTESLYTNCNVKTKFK